NQDSSRGFDADRVLGSSRTRILLEALTRIGFWDLPADEGRGELGFDGSQWIIEGVKDGKYHRIERWNGGEIRDWALLLMRK
ncbi:hypothetical protein OFN32_39010, partial [Escherichia coli]|nr:hypothetical protein [Escherichia coli]